MTKFYKNLWPNMTENELDKDLFVKSNLNKSNSEKN